MKYISRTSDPRCINEMTLVSENRQNASSIKEFDFELIKNFDMLSPDNICEYIKQFIF